MLGVLNRAGGSRRDLDRYDSMFPADMLEIPVYHEPFPFVPVLGDQMWIAGSTELEECANVMASMDLWEVVIL